jgi:hypothetical protein
MKWKEDKDVDELNDKDYSSVTPDYNLSIFSISFLVKLG